MKITMLALILGLTTSSIFSPVFAAEKTKTDCAKDDHYPLITKQELQKKLDEKNVFVVDVNSADSYKDAHVPTAIHFADHEKDFAKTLPAKKDSLIVAYCGGPKCEAWLKAAQKACELGYTNIQHFKDGISGWKKM